MKEPCKLHSDNISSGDKTQSVSSPTTQFYWQYMTMENCDESLVYEICYILHGNISSLKPVELTLQKQSNLRLARLQKCKKAKFDQ